jgi:hypothetical protein
MAVNDKDNSVNDRKSDYNRVKVYSSLEEQEDAHRTYAASLSPVECLRQAVMMIRKAYDYDNNPPKNTKRITIRKLS